jgi:4-hydroxy-tetrahydrodipicolinate synthase
MDKPRGIIPALSTITKESGELDEESQRSMVRVNIEWGASGLATSIVAGEFYKFTDEERIKTFKIAVEEANGKVPVWAGVAHLGTEPSLALARKAKEVGVDGIIAQAGLVGKDASGAMSEHFDTILSKIDIPLMIQDAEDFNGFRIDPAMYSKLAGEYSNLVSVKIEGGNTLEKIREAKSLVGNRLSILGGMGGRLILEELALGTDGSIPNSCLMDLIVETFAKSVSGRSQEARETFSRCKPWFEFQSSHSSSASEIVKETLRLRGIVKSSATRSPHIPLDAKVKVELKNLLEQMDLLGS